MIITDEEIDREIDFEFEKIYISSINDFNDKEKDINVVINDDEGVKSFNMINLGEDRQDTYSEISSTVRIQNGGQRQDFLNRSLNDKRGGKPVRSIERVQRSRLDPGVLRKIPIFNNNFCDLSNNDLNEFPVDLIDRIQNIKVRIFLARILNFLKIIFSTKKIYMIIYDHMFIYMVVYKSYVIIFTKI